MDKLIITAALTGNITLPTQTPHLPLTPQEIIDDAVRAANAGAASVHIHGRDPKTARPTTEPAVYKEIATGIKARSDVIVCVTTGGTMDMTPAQRAQVVPALKPELATFNTGSINFSIHPIADRYKDEEFKFPWEKEFASGTRDFIFRNTFGDIEKLCQIMEENNTKPEFEVYDVGHLYNLSFLVRKKIVKPPIWLQFVTGILGGIGSALEDIMYLKQTADRLPAKLHVVGDRRRIPGRIQRGDTLDHDGRTRQGRHGGQYLCRERDPCQKQRRPRGEISENRPGTGQGNSNAG
jgi:uncharacterized protein (DUF849 family)